jgi:PAS domain S-box-containing protein
MLILRLTFSPLKRMAATARKIAAGHLKIRMPKKGAGEIGELADALNAMLDKLQDRDTFCKGLIGSLPGIFCMIDAQGSLLMWNRDLEQVLQRSMEEMASCHLPDCFVDEDKINIWDAIHKALEEGEASVEAVLNAKDGTGRPCHLAGRRVERDGLPVLVWLGIDIPACDQAE